jgi:hypothetical protein
MTEEDRDYLKLRVLHRIERWVMIIAIILTALLFHNIVHAESAVIAFTSAEGLQASVDSAMAVKDTIEIPNKFFLEGWVYYQHQKNKTIDDIRKDSVFYAEQGLYYSIEALTPLPKEPDEFIDTLKQRELVAIAVCPDEQSEGISYPVAKIQYDTAGYPIQMPIEHKALIYWK